MSLPRLASENMLIRNSVHQICLRLTRGTYNEPCIVYGDLSLLRPVAFLKQMSHITWCEKTTAGGRSSDFAGRSVLVGQSGGYQAFSRLSKDEQTVLDTAICRFLPEAFLLLNFPNLEDLALSLSANHLGLILSVLVQGPVPLSALKSLTLSGLPFVTMSLDEELNLQIDDVALLSQVEPAMTDLYIRGFTT